MIKSWRLFYNYNFDWFNFCFCFQCRVYFEILINLISAIKIGSPPQLTTLGRTMSLFPLDPRFTKVILASAEHQCLEEALTVVALLSGESVFTDPPAKRQQAYVARSRYRCYWFSTISHCFAEYSIIMLLSLGLS